MSNRKGMYSLYMYTPGTGHAPEAGSKSAGHTNKLAAHGDSGLRRALYMYRLYTPSGHTLDHPLVGTVGAPVRPRLPARRYAAREALRTFDPFRRPGDPATCTFASLANGLLTVGGAS